jgi:hypothetical protein
MSAIAIAVFLLARAGTAAASPHALAAWLRQSWFRPGETAFLHVDARPGAQVDVQVFQVGGDDLFDRAAMGPAVTASAGVVPLSIGDWTSGVYVARVTGPDGGVRYAAFVVGPRLLGSAPVLVVEPTYTWQAYNPAGGDSWYVDRAVHVVDLARPYPADGLPPHFRDYDLGFLRWYCRSGVKADFVSDAVLLRFASGAQLRRLYRLIVFPGHDEYVTPHTYAIVRQFRDDGGNLAFLSADDFFYRVTLSGDSIVGRTRWRDLGAPEASLVGGQYAGWEEHRFRNKPYRVTDTAAAPWLFAGTGLHDGSTFGLYGIEIDERTAASPPETHVLAEIPGDFGPHVPAEMTLYRLGGATVFDAGVMNFGGSADWPVVSTLVSNLWEHLS